MSTVASLIATLGLDASDFNRGIDGAEGKAHGLSGTLGKIGGASLLALGAGAVAAGAGLASAIGTAATFEHQISAVGAVSGASKTQIEALSDKALQLGADTAFGATEAAMAMEELAAQGVPVEAILNGAADAVVALAAAGGVDLVTAATAASSAMGIWKLGSDDLVEVTNRLTGAANVSAFGIEDMTQGMAAGGIAAATFGISMEDTTTTLAALSKGGFQSGSDAGTSFKAMLTGLAAPAGAGKKAIDELGINVRDAGGKMLPVSGIIRELHSKLDGLGQEDRDAAMARIFGTDGMRAAGVLMTMTGEQFEAMSATMEATDAAAIAAQRMDNFKGAMDQVSGSIETVKIKVGLALLPILTTLALYMAGAIPDAFDAASSAISRGAAAAAPYVAMAIDLGRQVGDVLMPKLTAFTSWFTGNETAMRAAGAAIGGILVVAFIAMGVAAGSAAVSVLLALAPIVAVTAAAALLGAGIYLLITHWDDITAAFPPAAAALEQVRAAWSAFVGWVTGTFIPLFASLVSAVMASGTAIVTFVTEHWDQISAIIGAAGALIWGAVESTFALIASIVEGQLQIITGIINLVLGVLTGDWSRAWDGIKGIAEGVWTIISGVVEFGISTIKNLITNGGALLKAAWSLIWDVLDDMLAGAWDNIKGSVSSGISAVGGLISGAAGALKSAGVTAWDGIKAGAASSWDATSGWVKTLPGLAGDGIKAGAGKLLDAGRDILGKMKDGASEAWDDAEAWVKSLPGLAKDALVAGKGMLLEGGKALIQSAWDGAVEIWTMWVVFVHSIPGLAKAGLLLGVGLLLDAGKALLTGMWDGAVSIWIDTVAWVTGLPAKAVAAFGDAGQILAGVGRAIISGLWDGMKGAFGLVQDGLGELTSKIPSWKGPPSTDATLLTANGELIIGGLVQGFANGFPSVMAKLRQLTDAMGSEMNFGMAAFSATTADTLDGWTGALKDGIDEGHAMSLTEIGSMLTELEDALNTSGLPEAAKTLGAKTLLDLVEGFNESGSLANQALIDWIATIKKNGTEAGMGAGKAVANSMTTAMWNELTASGSGWIAAAEANWDSLQQWQKQILETLHFTQVAIQNGWDVNSDPEEWANYLKGLPDLPVALNEFGKWVATRDFQDSLGIWHTAGSLIDDATVASEKARAKEYQPPINGNTAVNGYYSGWMEGIGQAWIQGPDQHGGAYVKIGSIDAIPQYMAWDYAKTLIGKKAPVAAGGAGGGSLAASSSAQPGFDSAPIGAAVDGPPIINVNGSALLERLLRELNEAAIGAGLTPLVQVA